jgi:hypothetical protein
MSLLNTASEWNHKPNKKRTPALKRPLRPVQGESYKEGFDAEVPDAIQKSRDAINHRETRVASLLDKMTASEEANDESDLANFEPMENPELQVKRDFPPIQANNLKEPEETMPYAQAYSQSPSYRLPVMPGGAMPVANDKLMEKINYMIHMLEQQQHERTENITEEFILYSFLGLFVIYVCDSFTRVGKYSR